MMHRSQGSANCVALATGAESFKHLHRWHSIIGERLVRGGAQMYGGAPGQALITADEKRVLSRWLANDLRGSSSSGGVMKEPCFHP
ncbi:hypothetical protein CDAR_575831 [Caerostris darwini]|uniref:Uncharacterized protein n=1 Tax=Caerostris darwini TaxID=1538125 RepID=A0AAV4X989_9ARAC|nr:hypothetical protein CDAR_575831 [Caerostris darwini]